MPIQARDLRLREASVFAALDMRRIIRQRKLMRADANFAKTLSILV